MCTGFIPLTVIVCERSVDVIIPLIEDFYRSLLNDDDVWQLAFFETVVIVGPDMDKTINQQVNDTLNALGARHILREQCDADSLPPPGPYVAGLGRIWQPWRIYDDFANALMVTFAPHKGEERGSDVPRSWSMYDACYDTGGTRAIVPSRAYFTKTENRPLAGLRFVVKDCYDIKGFKSSLGSRAWLEYHEPATETAACVQRLVDLGAVLIGKAKLAHWIIRELPAECVDFSAPFNPRGCGFLTASESSHGNAAALVSYRWLDASLGTDSTCGLDITLRCERPLISNTSQLVAAIGFRRISMDVTPFASVKVRCQKMA